MLTGNCTQWNGCYHRGKTKAETMNGETWIHRQIIHPILALRMLHVFFCHDFIALVNAMNSIRCDECCCNITNVNTFKSWFTRCYRYSALVRPNRITSLVECTARLNVSLRIVCGTATHSSRMPELNGRIAENVEKYGQLMAKWHTKKANSFFFCVRMILQSIYLASRVEFMNVEVFLLDFVSFFSVALKFWEWFSLDAHHLKFKKKFIFYQQ